MSLCITAKLGSTNRKVSTSKLKFNTKYPRLCQGCAAFLSFDCAVLPNPDGNRMELKKMLNRSYPVNLNATFLLKSAYLHRTHHHTLLMGNLNATSPELHYCLKYGCIRRWLSLQLRPTVAPPTLPAVLCRQPWPVLQPECPVAV